MNQPYKMNGDILQSLLIKCFYTFTAFQAQDPEYSRSIQASLIQQGGLT